MILKLIYKSGVIKYSWSLKVLLWFLEVKFYFMNIDDEVKLGEIIDIMILIIIILKNDYSEYLISELTKLDPSSDLTSLKVEIKPLDGYASWEHEDIFKKMTVDSLNNIRRKTCSKIIFKHVENKKWL